MGDELDVTPRLSEGHPKAPRTPAQLEALAAARVKANEVRMRNAALRQKQRAIDKGYDVRLSQDLHTQYDTSTAERASPHRHIFSSEVLCTENLSISAAHVSVNLPLPRYVVPKRFF